MNKENPIIEKSLAFAASLVKLHNYLISEKQEDFISKHLLRRSTSISANANVAAKGIKKLEYISRLHILLKDTKESEYWLRRLVTAKYLTEEQVKSLLNDCLEVKRMLIIRLNALKNVQPSPSPFSMESLWTNSLYES